VQAEYVLVADDRGDNGLESAGFYRFFQVKQNLPPLVGTTLHACSRQRTGLTQVHVLKKKVKHIFNDHAVNTWVVTDKSTVCSEEQKVERHGSDKLPPANVYLRKNQVLPQ